jgi:hypothetical protein
MGKADQSLRRTAGSGVDGEDILSELIKFGQQHYKNNPNV